MEELLRESGTRMSSIYNTVDDAIFQLAVEAEETYRFISINQAFCNVTGLSQEQVVGKMVNEVIPEPSLTMVLKKYKQAIDENRIIRWEETSDYPTGRLVGEVSIAPISNDKGRCTNLVGSVHDITESKQAEKTLRESGEWRRDIMNSMADWIWEVDENGVYTYSSQKGFDFFGPSRENVIGKTPFDFMPPDEAKRVAAIFSEIATKKAPIKDLENWNIKKDGERICLLTNGVPIIDKAGNLKGYRGVDKDITERKRSEEALKESEEKYRNIFESSVIGIYRTSPDGHILLANPTLINMLGYDTFENLAHRNLEKEGFGPGYKRSEFRELLERDGNIIGLESAWNKEDGTTVFIRENAKAYRDGTGNVLYYDGTIEDITERRRVEQELIIANKELLFQNEEKEKRAAELVIANKELLFQNEEKEKRAAELIIANKELLFQNEEKEKRAAELIIANKELLFQNEEKEKRAAELIIANKELVFQNREKEKRADELFIANKELAFQNEEKEKRAAELNENKTLLASILDSSLSGIMALKSIRNTEGAIMDFEWQLVNATAEQMVSLSQTEILGKRLLEEMPGNRVEGLFDLYIKVVETGIPLSHEHYYEHEKVKTWFHTVAIKRLDGFVVTFSNITERKLAEQELIIANKELVFQNKEKEKRASELIIANKELNFQNEEKEKRAAELIIANKELLFQNEEKEKRAAELIKAWEKAKESDNLKSAFLNNLSHEIRTPMNQILGFASLLKDSDLTEVTRDEYIGIINSQSHQLLHIITDIVEISKISAGQVVIKSTSFNLSKMMNELYASFKPKAEHRNLQLSLNKKIADADDLIRGDQIKLNQIFSNLIENAIKFTDVGSVDIEYSRDGDMLIIAVKDSGIGIEEQEKQIIFNNFRQIEITMMRKYGGLGLGLSISSAYIRMMSGVIRVESEPGKGSTFFVEIPYLPAVRVSESTMNVLQIPVISRPDWQDKTLLIAEDEESNMYFLQEVLRSTGIHLLFAVNGLEAVEQCKINPEIDLVLMDIKMPRMDGLEATKIIKSFRSNLPVIATTAFAMTSDREYILEAGCDDYLPKPTTREGLIVKIQKWMGSSE